MVLAHIPALKASVELFIQSGLDPSRLGSLLGLTATTLFFILKLFDLPFLRFRTDRRFLVTVGLAVLLMHADALGACLNCENVPKELPVAATTLFAAGLARVQSAIETAFSHDGRRSRRHLWEPAAHDVAWFGAFVPHRRVAAALIFIPRAPPA
jgi:hypothetical protein